MENSEKRYEERGTPKPCRLSSEDLKALAQIIQETFTKPEIERYFRVSTNIGDTRVFSNSIEDFLQQKALPAQISEMTFWMEGWGEKTRADKNVLLDFSKYAIQLHVEGIDPVWVHDKYLGIARYLENKTIWYSPLITWERLTIFAITILLISNVIISLRVHEAFYYFDKAALLLLWIFLVFYDTRKIWPYSSIRLKDTETMFTRENLYACMIIMILVATIVGGTIFPFFKRH